MGDAADLAAAMKACNGNKACIKQARADFGLKPGAKTEKATAYTDSGGETVVVTDGGKVFYGGKVF